MAERLLMDLASLEDRVWLVIDDIHELGPEVLRQLELLVLRAPPQLRFVLASRHDVRLGLHRLRLEGELSEIRTTDLQFSLAETRQLFATAGVELPEAAAELVLERTEGWAAGLRLAALSLTGSPAPGQLAISGSERTVAEYLLAEVLERQSAQVRRLLLRTSVLERVNGELADLLAGGSGGERVLQDLEEKNAFVVSLDAQTARPPSWPAPSADACSRAADPNARVARAQCHREFSGAAQVLALVQGEDGVLGDQAEIAGVRAERGGRGAGRRVFDDAADGERVTDMEDGGRLPPHQLDRGQVQAMHEGFETREVVREIRQARACCRRENEVAGAGERDTGREGGVEVGGRPVERGERLCEVGVGDVLDVRLDTGEGGLDRPAFLDHLHRHGADGRREQQRAGTCPLGERDGGGDGGVPAERHLGLGAEVANAVSPFLLAAEALRGLGQER